MLAVMRAANLETVPCVPGNQPADRGRDRQHLAPRAHRRVPLPAVGAHPAQWARDKCPQQAAALAFQTALSLVPVTAIVFSILRGVGSLDAESRLSTFVSERLFPQLPDITDKIREFSGKVSIGALGGGGLLLRW